MSIKKKIISQKKILFVKKYTVGKKKKKMFSDKHILHDKKYLWMSSITKMLIQ